MNIYLQFLDKDNNMLREYDVDDLTMSPYEIPENATHFKVYGRIRRVSHD